MAGPVHYEVFIRRTAPAPWTLLIATEDRKHAMTTAEEVMADSGAAAVRVTKETLDSETMEFNSLTILTRGAPETKPKPRNAAAAGPASERGSAPGGASPRTSTSTTQTHKYGRRIKRPGFEPTQPGKYHLAGTVSLPTLNVARTAEQRARDETGLPETEPALIQSLLAAPSSSTVRARAGIINSIPFVEEAVPPGQVLVAEERKVLVRPVM